VTENGCVSDLFSDTITVYPNPVARFTASNIKGCMPLTSLFEVDSSNDENIHYVWSFGDGSTALGDSLSHTYLQSGYMSVTLIATNEHGCSSTFTEQDAVQVFEKPIAEFKTYPEIVFIGSDELTLTNLSENALHSYYIIGSDTILGATTTYSFSDEGVYPITQVVTSGLGCSDEITHTVTVEFGSEYYVPSAFTPNNDGKNDEFKIVGSEIKEFSLVIFDRWGNEIFESDDINTSWDGIASKDNPMPEGVYVYRLEMRSKTNKDIVKMSHLKG
jgi:gliding motility-associated-like protein